MTRPTPRAWTIVARAAAAFALPAAVALLLPHPSVQDLSVFLFTDGRWAVLSYVGLLILVVLELQCLGTVALLIQARWNLERYRALMTREQRALRRRRWVMRCSAAAVGCVFSLGVLEVVFRAFNVVPPPLSERPRIGEEELRASYNPWKAREEWDVLDEADPRVRVVFLGDSMTYGQGVPREDCFVHLVEQQIQPAFPDGAVTINLGIPGSAQERQLNSYLPYRTVIEPDVIVQMLYPNDFNESLTPYLFGIHLLERERSLLARHSYVVYYVERQVRRWLAWQRVLHYFRGGRDRRERQIAFERLVDDLRNTKRVAEEDGAAFVMILQPWLFQLDNYPIRDAHNRVRKIARELDVTYLDMLPWLAGLDEKDVRLSPVDEHPNARGHEIMAEAIAELLMAEETNLPRVRRQP